MSYLLGLIFMIGLMPMADGDASEKEQTKMQHHKMMHSVEDTRISLGLPPKMKQHQLANMRSHLEAIQEIIGLIAKEEFDDASEVAHSKLGLTDEMKTMCNMMGNEDFTKLGLSFHKSGDALGDALSEASASKNAKKSLDALQTTLGFCTQCHATYRQ